MDVDYLGNEGASGLQVSASASPARLGEQSPATKGSWAPLELR